jgi:hypothetical protein
MAGPEAAAAVILETDGSLTALPTRAGEARQASAAKSQPAPIERSFCGHWFHAACLEAKLTVPPFRLQCAHPQCGKEVYHPRFSDRIEKLEKRWAHEQEKKRELDEIAGLMSLE